MKYYTSICQPVPSSHLPAPVNSLHSGACHQKLSHIPLLSSFILYFLCLPNDLINFLFHFQFFISALWIRVQLQLPPAKLNWQHFQPDLQVYCYFALFTYRKIFSSTNSICIHFSSLTLQAWYSHQHVQIHHLTSSSNWLHPRLRLIHSWTPNILRHSETQNFVLNAMQANHTMWEWIVWCKIENKENAVPQYQPKP